MATALRRPANAAQTGISANMPITATSPSASVNDFCSWGWTAGYWFLSEKTSPCRSAVAESTRSVRDLGPVRSFLSPFTSTLQAMVSNGWMPEAGAALLPSEKHVQTAWPHACTRRRKHSSLDTKSGRIILTEILTSRRICTSSDIPSAPPS